jgi:hypothetical protein
MKKALCVASALLLLAGVAGAELVPLRIVADATDLPVSPAASPFGGPLQPGMGADFDANGNPVFGAPGTYTLNLWAEVGLADVWNGLGIELVTTGDLFASAALEIDTPLWSVVGKTGAFKVLAGNETAYDRWNPGSDNLGDSTGDFVTMAAVTESGLGGSGDVGLGATSVYDGAQYAYVLEQRGTWFKLGTVTVTGTNGQLYLAYRPTNFVGGEKGDGIMYYGWGASGIVNLDANLGAASDAALITVVPEPASLILLALAGLAIRRR